MNSPQSETKPTYEVWLVYFRGLPLSVYRQEEVRTLKRRIQEMRKEYEGIEVRRATVHEVSTEF